MFWGLGSGKRRESVRNRVQGCHWFWSAREIELRGSTAGQPRRRRGGDRRAAWGAWQSGEGTSARGQWVQGSRGVTRGAVAKLELACGRPRAAGGAAVRRRRASRQGKGKTGYFVISEISRDLNVKQG